MDSNRPVSPFSPSLPSTATTSFRSSWRDDDDGPGDAKSSGKSFIVTSGVVRDAATFAKTKQVMEDEILGDGRFADFKEVEQKDGSKVKQKVKDNGDIPAVDLIPATGSGLTAKENLLTIGNSTSFQGPCKYKVATQPGDGMLRFTLMCPVSGHNGEANARRWAKSDTFNIKVYLPSGETVHMRGVKSTGLVTPVDLAIPCEKGTTKIEYWRNGSLGVGGYSEGRTLYIDNGPGPARAKETGDDSSSRPSQRWNSFGDPSSTPSFGRSWDRSQNGLWTPRSGSGPSSSQTSGPAGQSSTATTPAKTQSSNDPGAFIRDSWRRSWFDDE